MFRNYLKTALRHFVRHKFFSVINVLCLAIGIAFSLIIGVYVFNQFSINKSLKNLNNQYILKSDWKVKEMGLDVTTFGPLAKILKEEYPSLVENYYRYDPVTNVVSAGDKHFKENIAIGDTTFISMYGFPVLYGNKQHAFADNNSAVITGTMAQKLFGKTNVIGKVISVLSLNNEEQYYKVSAVVKDIPFNSVTNLVGDTYNVFVPTTGNRYFSIGDPAEGWSSPFEVSMIELKPGITPKDLDIPLKQTLAKYTPGNVQDNLTIYPALIRDYYLKDHNGAVMRMLVTLLLAAIFILLMAIINFVNINIGASAYRLKEIGLRKVFGSKKKQLMLQFIAEALLLAIIAAIIAIILYEALRPVFGQIFNTSFESVFRFNATIIVYLIALIVITGFVAGIYPAFVLSSLNTVKAVKGKINTAKGRLTVRKGMLVIQFALALIVFISAVTISKQVAYIFLKDIGYNKEQLMVITAFPKQWDAAGINRMMNIRNAMLGISSVKSASVSFEIPDRQPPNSIDLQPVNGDDKTVLVTSFGADENYAGTFALKLLNGTCFAQSGGFIPNQLVLNESAVKALGLTVQSAVNAQLKMPSSPGTVFTIAGVIKDYNYSSLQDHIAPVALFNVKDAQSYRYLSLKLNTPNMDAAVKQVRKKWKELSPNSPFEFTFMDQKFQSLYKTELQLKKASCTATILALIIILLGIAGLMSLIMQRRVKEIGIRKVLGSSAGNILLLFIKEFLGVILIGGAIACPVAYLIMQNWLREYAYRINITALPFVIAIVCLGLITTLLICAQTIKTAMANPVAALRSE
ncbi:ABC transporter permease [Parafilimonas sp.]|uniref:ABC transporter permease n=1 Tax=Parafilimonas sp. TaxID=1969739 RepID=UPI0039E59B71